MTLGLKRGAVRLVDYDPNWSIVFEQEKLLLGHLLGQAVLAIEHVGSTSVFGLRAKPIIDVAIAVDKSESFEAWELILRKEGYTYFGDRESRGDRFFAKGPEENRTIYLHVVLSGSVNWTNYLLFRNQLRANSHLRQTYELLKKELALASPTDRSNYSKTKAAFIQKVLLIKL